MAYKRRQLLQRKCSPFVDVNGICSFLEAIDNLQKNAEHFVYPFTMMQGDLDDVVSNPGALIWYKNAKGVKPADKSKIMFKGATHELHTEPQPLKADVLKHAMAFMAKRMSLPQDRRVLFEKAKGIKQGFLGKIIRSPQVKLVRMVIFMYLVIGLLFVLIKKRRRLFLQWPGAILSNLAIYK